ncbi:MAG: 50S ribosomal protein L9 [Anaerolineae bacterium]|nr:50S ribosomal protein L9 [Anaerolineae bacterium]
MKVILKDYVYKHGVAGDVVDVAPGFARNYLIPRGLAIMATQGALRANKVLIVKADDNRERLMAMENEAAAKIDGVELIFGVKAGKNNKLYGSVTTRDIADSLLEKTEVDIDRRRVSERPLRELGIHDVPIRISATAAPVIKVVIVREEEVTPYLNGEMVDSLVALGFQKREGAEEEIEDEIPVGDEADVEEEVEYVAYTAGDAVEAALDALKNPVVAEAAAEAEAGDED